MAETTTTSAPSRRHVLNATADASDSPAPDKLTAAADKAWRAVADASNQVHPIHNRVIAIQTAVTSGQEVERSKEALEILITDLRHELDDYREYIDAAYQRVSDLRKLAERAPE